MSSHLRLAWTTRISSRSSLARRTRVSCRLGHARTARVILYIIYSRLAIYCTLEQKQDCFSLNFLNHPIKKDLNFWFHEEAGHGHTCGNMRIGCQSWGDVKENCWESLNWSRNLLILFFFLPDQNYFTAHHNLSSFFSASFPTTKFTFIFPLPIKIVPEYLIIKKTNHWENIHPT